MKKKRRPKKKRIVFDENPTIAICSGKCNPDIIVSEKVFNSLKEQAELNNGFIKITLG